MQPSNSSGRHIRLALMPISWLVAFVVVYLNLELAAALRASSIPGLLQTKALWPLLLIVPALFFGKVLGLMLTNLVAHATPPFRKAFEEECRATGRHDFSAAMKGLYVPAIALFVITGVCLTIYVLHAKI